MACIASWSDLSDRATGASAIAVANGAITWVRRLNAHPERAKERENTSASRFPRDRDRHHRLGLASISPALVLGFTSYIPYTPHFVILHWVDCTSIYSTRTYTHDATMPSKLSSQDVMSLEAEVSIHSCSSLFVFFLLSSDHLNFFVMLGHPALGPQLPPSSRSL